MVTAPPVEALGEALAEAPGEGLATGGAAADAEGAGEALGEAPGLGVEIVTGGGAPFDFRYSTRSFISVSDKLKLKEAL